MPDDAGEIPYVRMTSVEEHLAARRELARRPLPTLPRIERLASVEGLTTQMPDYAIRRATANANGPLPLWFDVERNTVDLSDLEIGDTVRWRNGTTQTVIDSYSQSRGGETIVTVVFSANGRTLNYRMVGLRLYANSPVEEDIVEIVARFDPITGMTLEKIERGRPYLDRRTSGADARYYYYAPGKEIEERAGVPVAFSDGYMFIRMQGEQMDMVSLTEQQIRGLSPSNPNGQ